LRTTWVSKSRDIGILGAKRVTFYSERERVGLESAQSRYHTGLEIGKVRISKSDIRATVRMSARKSLR
jgi:hypothetical protein